MILQSAMDFSVCVCLFVWQRIVAAALDFSNKNRTNEGSLFYLLFHFILCYANVSFPAAVHFFQMYLQ